MDAPPSASSRVLLPAVWCVWLAAWLVPALLIAPHLDVVPAWVGADAAPAATMAGAVVFLAALWPFWPAWAGPVNGRIQARWVGLGVLELATLLALAAPFVLVARAVGSRAVEVTWVALGLAVAGALGLGFRIAWGGCGPAAGRWLMMAAMLLVALPVGLAYVVAETMNMALVRVFEAGPIAASMYVALEGAPETTWRLFTGLVLWPVAGAVLVAVGLSEQAWRYRRGEG